MFHVEQGRIYSSKLTSVRYSSANQFTITSLVSNTLVAEPVVNLINRKHAFCGQNLLLFFSWVRIMNVRVEPIG